MARRPLRADTEPGRVILEGKLFQVDDAQTATHVSSHLRDYARKIGRHGFLYCPMMRDGVSMASIGARKEAAPFSQHEIGVSGPTAVRASVRRAMRVSAKESRMEARRTFRGSLSQSARDFRSRT
jgi:hypothetical protein